MAALSASHEAVAAHHGNNYLPVCEQYYKSPRLTLFALVEAVELEATSAERAVLEALEFVRANRDADRRAEGIEESVLVERDGQQVVLRIDVDAFAGPLWKRTLRDRRRPGMPARRHLEVCVFSHLAAELRSGDIAVVGSDSYANLHTQLMAWQECESQAGEFCVQAGIPSDPKALVAHYRSLLAQTAREVDEGYAANTDLRLEGGRPVLGRCVVTAFAYGGNFGPTEVARHMRGISAHEIYTAGNKHADPGKIYKASADVVNAFAALDVTQVWGDGSVAAADGSQIDTWEDNLRAESHVRYGGFGALAFQLVSDSYIALFGHFIPCGVWEAVYLLDSLLCNVSAIQPDAIHADTQGGVAACFRARGHPRIRSSSEDQEPAPRRSMASPRT
ncbi:Tn3 family transposase [Nonomuraea sp. NPDC050404]|uniref:Tn3 family transposase n=1 Tax=Nonomuraea sp. NPDC050404 TaxID=3155783 RepID=UPI00340C6B92